MNRRLALALKIAVSAACLAALWFWIEPARLAARLRHASPWPLAAAAGLNLLLQGLNAAKLRAVFPPPRPAFRGLLEVNLISVFLGAFIPGGGGEVARWAYLSRECGSPGRALAGALLDRLTGLWAQILLALAAWVWIGRGTLALGIAVPAAAAALAASVWAGIWGYRGFARLAARAATAYARRRGGAVPEDIGPALEHLLSGRGRALAVAALSVANHVLVIASFVLLDRSAGGDIGWAQAALFLFCYTLVVLLPLTVGNWGLSEGTLGVLYHYSGAQSETGVLISLLIRAAAVPAMALGWLCFLGRRGKRDRP